MYDYPYSYSAWDEYPIHQTADVLSVPLSTAPRFMDHFCMMVHPKGPGPMVYTSFYVYPNTRILQSSAAVNYGGKQYQIRGQKQYMGDPSVLELGPLSQAVDIPLVKRSTRLAENDLIPVSYDLVATAAYPMVDMGINHGAVGPRQNAGIHWYSQLMTIEGEITVEGETFDASGYLGQRDRGWGVPGRVEGEERGVFGFWLYLHFDDFGVELFYLENEHSAPVVVIGGFVYKDGSRKIARYIDHDVVLEEYTRLWTKYEIVVEMENGDRHTLSFKRLGEWNAYGAWFLMPERDENGNVIAPKSDPKIGGHRKLGRGNEPYLESDIIDRTDREFQANVAALDGRQTPVEVTLDGTKKGYGVLEDSVGRRSQYGWMI